MKFKDFQAPVLFSSTFKAFNLGEKKFKYFQGLSRMQGNPAYINMWFEFLHFNVFIYPTALWS